MNSDDPMFRIYAYFRSSASGRLRIASNIKNIPVQYVSINLLKGEQNLAAYKQINPSQKVPAVVALRTQDSVVAAADETLQRPLSQSVAVLEYWEEALPNHVPHLLPPIRTPADIDHRAQIRSLVNIISCDLQPLGNTSVLNRIRKLAAGGTTENVGIQFVKESTIEVFTSYEEQLKKTARTYCVGDELSLADVCLVPAVWSAERWGVSVEDYPTMNRVFNNLSKLDAVKKAHWRNQADTPENLREGGLPP